MRKTILTLILGLSLLTVTRAFAQASATVSNNRAVLNFPESVMFSAAITSDLEIRSIVLEYGNEQQTCCEVIAPVSVAVLANHITPTPIPTSSFGEPTPEVPVRTAPPLWLTLTLLGMCCIFLILIGIVILGFVVRNQNIKEAKNAE